MKEIEVSVQSMVYWVSTSSTTKDAYLLTEMERGETIEGTDFLWVLSIFCFKREMQKFYIEHATGSFKKESLYSKMQIAESNSDSREMVPTLSSSSSLFGAWNTSSALQRTYPAELSSFHQHLWFLNMQLFLAAEASLALCTHVQYDQTLGTYSIGALFSSSSMRTFSMTSLTRLTRWFLTATMQYQWTWAWRSASSGKYLLHAHWLTLTCSLYMCAIHQHCI